MARRGDNFGTFAPSAIRPEIDEHKNYAAQAAKMCVALKIDTHQRSNVTKSATLYFF
jgi:hypothetical protein